MAPVGTAQANLKDEGDDFVESYLADARFRKFTPATIRSYESNLHRYHDFLHSRGTSPERVGTPELKAFLQLLVDQKFEPDTILNYFSSISSYYEYMVQEGKIHQNPTPPFRRRYLRNFAKDRENKRSHPTRQIPDVAGARALVRSGMGARDHALLLVLLKTGIRREETELLDVEDVNLTDMYLRVHPHRKRANTKVFFDEETRRALQEWIELRRGRVPPGEIALFLNPSAERLRRSGIYKAVMEAATRAGIHNPASKRPEDRFTPHHCRHWFTSTLLNRGMPRQFVQWLRGDHATEAVDQYFHADEAEIRRRYLASMPTLGVYAE